MTGIKILENKFLEYGTIMVSSDIAKILREQYTEEGKDLDFLQALGIKTEELKNDTENR